ncbi:MAG: translation initiation factor IF-3 [Patescibacteria group bacterium]|nr:translation initiation factor IF-3 [Patescibacteria group bacterium]
MAKKYYKINEYINATEVRVIGADEKQIGVMTRDEAIFKARQMKMDLVLVADKAKPPVAKIINFAKFKYQQKQDIKKSKKQTKVTGQKEIRFTPFIAKKDFETRLKRAQKFLEDRHKVKLTVKFTGRQITRKEFGFKLLKKAANHLIKFGTQSSEPKLQGKLLWIIITPLKK